MLGTPIPNGCRERGHQSEPGDAVEPGTEEGLVFRFLEYDAINGGMRGAEKCFVPSVRYPGVDC